MGGIVGIGLPSEDSEALAVVDFGGAGTRGGGGVAPDAGDFVHFRIGHKQAQVVLAGDFDVEVITELLEIQPALVGEAFQAVLSRQGVEGFDVVVGGDAGPRQQARADRVDGDVGALRVPFFPGRVGLVLPGRKIRRAGDGVEEFRGRAEVLFHIVELHLQHRAGWGVADLTRQHYAQARVVAHQLLNLDRALGDALARPVVGVGVGAAVVERGIPRGDGGLGGVHVLSALLELPVPHLVAVLDVAVQVGLESFPHELAELHDEVVVCQRGHAEPDVLAAAISQLDRIFPRPAFAAGVLRVGDLAAIVPFDHRRVVGFVVIHQTDRIERGDGVKQLAGED